MKQTVYVDVLVSVNLIVDYFLLYAAAVISGRSADRVRMCLGAVIGAVGSLTIFLPQMPAAVGVFIALVLSGAMTAAAFGWRGWKAFWHSLVVMYALSAAYSGLMLLLWNFSGSKKISVNNGSVYIDIDPKMLIAATVILYAAMSLFSGRIRSRNLSRRRCAVTISENNAKVTVEGLIDTGNTLTEPFSGMPVLVASEKAVRGVVPEWVSKPDCIADLPAGENRRVRIIPFHTAGGSGLMAAYRPERIDIKIDGSTVNDVKAYIAVAPENRRMSDVLLINPDAINY